MTTKYINLFFLLGYLAKIVLVRFEIILKIKSMVSFCRELNSLQKTYIYMHLFVRDVIVIFKNTLKFILKIL